MKLIIISLIVLLTNISILAQRIEAVFAGDSMEKNYNQTTSLESRNRIKFDNNVVPNPDPKYANDGLTRQREGFFYIDFEDYSSGEAPGEPWVYGPGVVSATVSGTAYSGENALGIVSDYSYSNAGLSYPISFTEEDGNVVIQVKIRPPHYAPGAYQAGYGTLAGVLIHPDQGTSDPGVFFDINKPYTSPAQPSHYIIRTKDPFSGIGTFLPGQWHDVTTTFDWQSEIATTVITRPDGISYTETWTIEGSELQQISLLGGGSWLPQATRTAMFDDVEVTGPAELSSPEVSISILAETVIMNWPEVQGANSYFIYASDNPTADDWGEHIAQVDELEYSEDIQENRLFYKVVASSEPIRNYREFNDVNN